MIKFRGWVKCFIENISLLSDDIDCKSKSLIVVPKVCQLINEDIMIAGFDIFLNLADILAPK